ncbi:hypothetical protein BV98_001330 [Sphingobium herbicidovorans NBRC 16415]|uniref:Uncharacterized protein n=1 Tax=Sphingobium herbicidovorans (strain ATCC 700291 / DSM 11019 / CCUG 56400 / KCTC 2939 / LMG 18315 / NBRC 16415 / MH) TaxID=1219045 RepID=A0A086PBN1_SPHHM|nr:hypothetical protein [Sphingobium herbicidovorans]KFG90799.1 hypothetical protein BV98_001330 [Sphingobium herbicidovorans NBRC 16415]
MFQQADLFAPYEAASNLGSLPDLIERISQVSKRPRYAFMVLNLIYKAVGQGDSVGPYVRYGGALLPVRDWLCEALIPLAQRDGRRRTLIEAVRADLVAKGKLPEDPAAAEIVLAHEVKARILRSGRTSISRAASDLVRAGLLRRHYKGYRVDHANRGAQREAVYTITPEARRALGRVH